MIAEWARVFFVSLSVCNGVSSVTNDLDFPSSFKFGTASSALQVEGAWNISDKSESIWDRFAHIPGNIQDGNNADVACDSYHLWGRDVDMLAELGVQMYRFSISWTRLLPNGFANYVSEDGKRYYSDLIDALLKRGIEPVVTLFHYDLPQKLQELGGWANPHISDWFADYAKVAFTLFSDRVKTWITINEGTGICDFAYMNGSNIAPGVFEKDIAPYLCNKHVLLAHAKAWRIYNQNFKALHQGKVSLANHITWFEPYTNSTTDVLYSKVMNEFSNGRYLQPIFSKQGGWPAIVEKYLQEYSLEQGFPRSVLPVLTQEEIEFIRGTYDFLAMNYYTSRAVRSAGPEEKPTDFRWGAPINAVLDVKPDWEYAFVEMLPINPEGLRHVLSGLKEKYGDVEILITENGYSSSGHQLRDDKRIQFIKNHLQQILFSIKQDGVNVVGYTHWALMDVFELSNGYLDKFGLYEVNFTDPHRTRTPRKSAIFYAKVIRSHSLNESLYLSEQ